MTGGRPAGGVRCCGSLDVLPCRSKGIPGGSYSTPDWFTHSAPWGPRHPRVTARAIHRPSGGESLDIACGVGVGVRLVPAHRTGEQPSAPRPGHRVPVAARRARLRGGLRRHKQQLRPEQWRLIDQLATPLARGIVQDGPIESSLGPRVSPRLLMVPLALAVMPFTRRSSIPTQPWRLARSVVSLWVKSARRRVCRARSRAISAMVRRIRPEYLPRLYRLAQRNRRARRRSRPRRRRRSPSVRVEGIRRGAESVETYAEQATPLRQRDVPHRPAGVSPPSKPLSLPGGWV